MSQRKPYLPPRVSRQEFGSDYLKWMAGLESGTQEQPVSSQRKVEPDYKAVVNKDRRFVEVSDRFCKLVGYAREELLSMRYDDVTAPNTKYERYSNCPGAAPKTRLSARTVDASQSRWNPDFGSIPFMVAA